MKKLILLPIALLSFWCYGQEYSVPVVVPQSPQAASLSKYNEYPVGNFTGIPSISIPLYTISSGDITIPLELSYHAGGFRVNEEASWVGLGWTLSGDYVISQSVKGADDFTGYNGGSNVLVLSYLNAPKIIDIMSSGSTSTGGYFGDQCIPGEINPGDNGFNCGGGLYNGDYSYCHSDSATVDGKIVDYSAFCNLAFDWEPDVFSLSIPGAGGKFVLGQDTTVYFLEKQDLKVKKNNQGFLVTTSDGIQYEFYKRSITTNAFYQETGAEWHLTRVISSKNPGKQVRIVYREGDWISQYSYSAMAKLEMNSTSYIIEPKPVTTSKYKETYIDSIFYDEGYVKFYSKINGRTDLKDADLLDSIRIFNYKKTPIKTFVFKTSNFIAATSGGGYLAEYLQAGIINNSNLTHRLKLDTLIERNGKKDQKKHIFGYSTIKLPSKDSYSQDHWGFYNGEPNSSLLPAFEDELYYERPDYGVKVYHNIPGANRKANPSYANACILKKIIYPTGGYTSFEYEANTFENTYATHSSTYFYQDYVKWIDILCSPDTSPIIEIHDPPYPQDAVQIENMMVSMIAIPWNYTGYPPLLTDNSRFQISISGTDNLGYPDNIYESYGWQNDDYNDDDYPYWNSISNTHNLNGIFNTTGPINMNVIVGRSYESKRIQYSFYCRVKRPISSLTEENYAGGLRIKRIEHYDGNNVENNIIKTYEYTNGLLKTPVRYYHMIDRDSEYGFTKFLFSSNARNSLSYNQGSHIGYSKVIEKIGANGESGKTEFVFDNHENRVMQMNFKPPSVPNSYQELFDGKLIYKNIYDQSGLLVTQTINHYGILDEKIIKGIYQTGYNGVYSIGRGGFHYYPIYARWEALIGTDEISFDRSNASDSVINSTTYGYTGLNHIQPTSVGKTLSDGSLSITLNKYAGDYTFTECQTYLSDCNTTYKNQLQVCDESYWNCLPTWNVNDSCYSRYQIVYQQRYDQNYIRFYAIYNFLYGHDKAIEKIEEMTKEQTALDYSLCRRQYIGPCYYALDSCRQSAENQLEVCQANYEPYVIAYRDLLDDKAIIIDELGQKAPATLVESVTYRDNTVTEGTLYQFKQVGTAILPSEIFSLNVLQGLAFTPSSIVNHIFSSSGQYKSQIKINYYDNGNIKEALKTDDYTTTYIWGYNENYPVAKIENLPYASVSQNVKTNVALLQNYTSMGDESIRNNLKQLNTTIRGLLGPRIMISTYTYIPSVGVTSETNPNNITIYYEYDNMGRLKLIRDHEGNIVKTFKYQYK